VPHAVRRNIDLTYIVMDNQIYGLTKGQLSPPRAWPDHRFHRLRSMEDPVNPLLYALAYGAGFVPRACRSTWKSGKMIEEAIRYPGFSS